MKDKNARIYLDNLEGQTKVHFYKSPGPGGQRKNKKETAVRLHHIPTGITVVATESRSQAQNRELAFRRLKKRLIELTKRKKPRKPSKIPIAIKEKILRAKKIHSQIKILRKPVNLEEY